MHSGEQKLSPLTELNLNQIPLTDEDVTTFATVLEQNPITTLSLSGTGLTSKRLRVLMPAIEKSRHLKKVYLQNNLLGDDPELIFDLLRICPQLTHVDIRKTAIATKGVQRLAVGLHHNRTLVFLDISENKLDDANLKLIFDSLISHPELNDLRISDNSLTAASAQNLIEFLKNNPLVSQVFYHGMPCDPKQKEEIDKLLIKAVDADKLRKQPALASPTATLKTLNFADKRLTDKNLLLLQAIFVKNSHLTSVALNNNRFSPEGLASILPHLSNQKDLVHLDLSGNKINKAAALALQQLLINQPNLKELVLGNTELDNDAAIILSEGLKQNTSLKVFMLNKNKIEDEGLKALAMSLYEHPSLEVFDLEQNPFRNGEEILTLLQHNPRIHGLKVARSGYLSEEDYDAIQLKLSIDCQLTREIEKYQHLLSDLGRERQLIDAKIVLLEFQKDFLTRAIAAPQDLKILEEKYLSELSETQEKCKGDVRSYLKERGALDQLEVFFEANIIPMFQEASRVNLQEWLDKGAKQIQALNEEIDKNTKAYDDAGEKLIAVGDQLDAVKKQRKIPKAYQRAFGSESPHAKTAAAASFAASSPMQTVAIMGVLPAATQNSGTTLVETPRKAT